MERSATSQKSVEDTHSCLRFWDGSANGQILHREGGGDDESSDDCQNSVSDVQKVVGSAMAMLRSITRVQWDGKWVYSLSCSLWLRMEREEESEVGGARVLISRAALGP